jgi:dihydrodipicolinate synthase/N-acetylneuraminate lyase
MSVRDWLRGPVVAVPTPFHDDFSLDLDGLRANLGVIVERGVRRGEGVLLVAGAAGEFPALSREERVAVMRASVAAADGTPVAASIQHTDWRETIELARAAEAEGVEIAQLGVPYYYNATADDLVRLVEAVGAASSIPLMIYSTWWEGGLDMDAGLVRRLAELPNVEALKWSAPTYDRFTDGVVAGAERLVVIDNQAMHAWGHLLGANGFVTHVGNFWPEYALEIWRTLERRDYPALPALLERFKSGWSRWAGAVQAETGGEGPFIKAAMREAGLAAGPPRPPSAEPSADRIAELRALFAGSGVPVQPAA